LYVYESSNKDFQARTWTSKRVPCLGPAILPRMAPRLPSDQSSNKNVHPRRQVLTQLRQHKAGFTFTYLLFYLPSKASKTTAFNPASLLERCPYLSLA
ncbi:hypothetical protein L249_7652, partial [Ophiocordyceps polyrhachis-furcata BCC 54312]